MPLDYRIPLMATKSQSDLQRLARNKQMDERWDISNEQGQQRYQDTRQDKYKEMLGENEVESWLRSYQALEAGDLAGVEQVGLQRKQLIDEGIRQGFQVDSRETDGFMELARTNAPEAMAVAERNISVLQQMGRLGNQQDVPMDWRTSELYRTGTKEQRDAFDKTKRSQQWLNQGYQFANPATAQTLPIGLKPGEEPETRAAQTRAVEEVKAGVKKRGLQPKRVATLAGQSAKIKMLDGLIDRAKKDASVWTTGFMGSALEGVAQTPAHDLSKNLATIKANIGFDRLQEMRDNSPTGGALGQVSEMENRLLQAVWGNLEQSQSQEQFVENLELVKQAVRASWERVSAAYEQDYGQPYSGDKPFTNRGGEPLDAEFDALYRGEQ